MPSRKISKSRKHSRRSIKHSHATKVRSRKSQRGGGIYEFSVDKKTWYPAKFYQKEAIDASVATNQSIYKYNKNGYEFTLTIIPAESSGHQVMYQMTRGDGSFAYLRFKMYQENNFIKAFARRITDNVG